MKKIDIYNHVLPPAYFDLVKAHSKDAGIVKRMAGLPMLWDLEARAKMLVEKFPDVVQVLTLSAPAPEYLGGPDQSPEFARVANDGMADICKRWPDQFPVFVASLPMNNVPAALKEMDRAIGELGARGVQIITNVNGRPLDDPEFYPVFERMANKHELPIWMHPFRPGTTADYKGEERSKYEIWQVLGWPFETSVAMSRMVFSGLLEKLPNLKIITHHCGGMLPYFAGRAESLWAQLGSRSADGSEADVLKRLPQLWISPGAQHRFSGASNDRARVVEQPHRCQFDRLPRLRVSIGMPPLHPTARNLFSLLAGLKQHGTLFQPANIFSVG